MRIATDSKSFRTQYSLHPKLAKSTDISPIPAIWQGSRDPPLGKWSYLLILGFLTRKNSMNLKVPPNEAMQKIAFWLDFGWLQILQDHSESLLLDLKVGWLKQNDQNRSKKQKLIFLKKNVRNDQKHKCITVLNFFEKSVLKQYCFNRHSTFHEKFKDLMSLKTLSTS